MRLRLVTLYRLLIECGEVRGGVLIIIAVVGDLVRVIDGDDSRHIGEAIGTQLTARE